jgi:mRNA interferase MazF
MKEGDIALAELNQADKQSRLRPVLLLREMPGYGDWLVAGISSQIHQFQDNWDVMIYVSDASFSQTGLKKDSIVRLSFLAVLPSALLSGTIGSINTETLNLLRKRLADYIVWHRVSE